MFASRTLEAVQLTLVWALAAAVVGAAFGFLLGHPRRTAEDKAGKEERTSTNWLLRTGLDDMVDWLVKGLTTVLLVQASTLIEHVGHLAMVLSAGLMGTPEAEPCGIVLPIYMPSVAISCR